ncbi:hypothetical protein [Pseudomonas sp. NA-150]|uniref:hypothetical protein n=1 Tax=Pseudomonas sp. NA-150 TaxID=3367525 RepID=UPI0037C7FF64
MSNPPTDKQIADLLGITENEVGTYKTDAELMPNGLWLIYFGWQTPQHLRKGLSSKLTLVFPRLTLI